MISRVKVSGFGSEPENWRLAELAAIDRVLRSGNYILGREVAEFERIWALTCGVPYAVGVANGMDAIEIGLRAMGVAKGDEIITTPMTAFATVLAIIRSGATPVLADIDPETALLDLKSVERCVTPKTRAVLLVHLYGRIHQMDTWLQWSGATRLALVEDCAQSHIACWKSRVAGSFGVFGAYSFYPTKNLGAAGDAGALVTSTETLAEQARRLRNYGQSTRYLHPEIGLNSRLDEIHAAILLERVNKLTELTRRRQRTAEQYWTSIDNSEVKVLARPNDMSEHVQHLFVVRCDRRDRLAGYLNDKHIDSLIHYPVPVHWQESCKNWIRTDPKGLFNAELHASTCLSLPCHPFLTDDEVMRVIDAVNGYA